MITQQSVHHLLAIAGQHLLRDSIHPLELADVVFALADGVFIAGEGVEVYVAGVVSPDQPVDKLQRSLGMDAPEGQSILGT